MWHSLPYRILLFLSIFIKEIIAAIFLSVWHYSWNSWNSLMVFSSQIFRVCVWVIDIFNTRNTNLTRSCLQCTLRKCVLACLYAFKNIFINLNGKHFCYSKTHMEYMLGRAATCEYVLFFKRKIWKNNFVFLFCFTLHEQLHRFQ